MNEMEKRQWDFPEYSLDINEDQFGICSRGSRFFRFPVRSAVPSKEGADRDDALLAREVIEEGNKVNVIWKTRSSRWEKKEYCLSADQRGFTFTIRLYGKGIPREIRYFEGEPGAKRPGALYETSGYLLPFPEFQTETHFYSMAEDGEIGLKFQVPPAYCFPYHLEDAPGFFGLGLCAKPGNFVYDHFRTQCRNGRLQLVAPLSGRTKVEGMWETPGILGVPGKDEWEVLSRYSEWHYQNGCARRGTRSEDWWYGPYLCGWGEQAPLGEKYGKTIYDMASEEGYRDISAHLDALDLHPTALIIDDKWQRAYGEALPDPQKWPDMRRFVDGEHQKGRKVVLWFKSWNCEGLPADECITLWSQPIAADPTNPKYMERMRQTMRTLLSDEEGCYNCDGFKIDFADCMPQGDEIRTWEPGIAGVELLRRLYKLFYDCAKAVKPDALINCSNGHPYLAEFTDQARLHDYNLNQRCVNRSMKFRRELFRAAIPEALIDTDFPSFGCRQDTMNYIRFAKELGVPDLYRLSDTEDCIFTEDDWAEVRRIWKEYREQL